MAKRVDDPLLPLLAEFARTGDPELRDAVVTASMALVEHIAQRYRFTGEPLDDILQEGRIGLLNAIQMFDASRGVKFSTYASHTVQGAIQHYLRDKGKLIREPGWLHDLNQKVNKAAGRLRQQLGREPEPSEVAAELRVEVDQVAEVFRTRELFRVSSLEAPPGDDDGAGPNDDERLPAEPNGAPSLPLVDQLALREAVAALPATDRAVVLDFFFHDLSKAAIADKLGTSSAQVSQMLRRALRELRDLLLGADGESTPIELRQRRADLESFVRRSAEPSQQDPVTGLYGFDYLRERLEEEVERSRRWRYELSVCLIGLHDLEAYRRHEGAFEADRLLRLVAEVLGRSSRRSDLVGRFGRDGFVFLLPQTGTTATVLANRCRASLASAVRDTGTAVRLELFAGIAVYPLHGGCGPVLTACAERALRAAIGAGAAAPVQLAEATCAGG